MKSISILLVLVCVTVAVNGLDKCFKDDEFKKWVDELKVRMFIPIAKKCKEENPNITDKETGTCCMNKFKAAMKICEKENPNEDHTTNSHCAMEKLGLECSEEDKDFGKFKAKTLELTLDDKKKIVEDACTPCEKEKHFHKCISTNLKDKCAEVKDMCKQHEHI